MPTYDKQETRLIHTFTNQKGEEFRIRIAQWIIDGVPKTHVLEKLKFKEANDPKPRSQGFAKKDFAMLVERKDEILGAMS